MSGEDSQIIATTREDIKRLEGLIVGNSLRSMRIVLRRVERRRVVFQNRLVELYRNEKIIKARIYNNADALKIDTDYTAGKGKRNIPTQSFEGIVIADDPHHSMSYDKFNIMTTVEGVRKLDAEINRINGEIKELQSAKNLYDQKYKELKKQLGDAEKKKNERSGFARTFNPTEEDLLADQIAQAKTANILLLQGISENFKNLTTPLSELDLSGEDYGELIKNSTIKGVVRYPDGDRRAIRQLEVYQQLFWAHGHSKGLTVTLESDEVVTLASRLNFDNPGDTKNTEVLEEALEIARIGAKNEKKMSLAVDRYIRDVDSVIADPLISKGVEIRPDITAPLSESMRADTLSYPTSALRIGDFYLGSFELPTLGDAIRKAWKKRNARLYHGLPVCPNAKPSGTSTDIKEEEAEDIKDIKTIQAQYLYLEKLAEAKNFVAKEVEISLGDLPDEAPEWVKTYVKRYQKASLGVIVYLGNQVTISRGTSKESAELALYRARKMVIFPSPPPDKPEEGMEEKANYGYVSVMGWAWVKQEKIVFTVSLEEMKVIRAGKIPDRLGKENTEIVMKVLPPEGGFSSFPQSAESISAILATGGGNLEPGKEFVAYVMWGQIGAL